jgi:hypothetical protein
MDLEKKHLIVWLGDQYAKLLLGLDQPRDKTRWAAIGECVGESPYGIWLSVKEVTEGMLTEGKQKYWTATPRTCYLRWDGIISIQMQTVGEHLDRARPVGFTSLTR